MAGLAERGRRHSLVTVGLFAFFREELQDSLTHATLLWHLIVLAMNVSTCGTPRQVVVMLILLNQQNLKNLRIGICHENPCWGNRHGDMKVARHGLLQALPQVVSLDGTSAPIHGVAGGELDIQHHSSPMSITNKKHIESPECEVSETPRGFSSWSPDSHDLDTLDTLVESVLRTSHELR